jgi:hypothetical protein
VIDSAVVPVISYSNADTKKIAILNDNRKRVVLQIGALNKPKE